MHAQAECSERGDCFPFVFLNLFIFNSIGNGSREFTETGTCPREKHYLLMSAQVEKGREGKML